MTVETASYLSQLDATYPQSSDLKSEGDNHLRLIKSAVKATFPNLTAAPVTPSTTEMNYVTGVTSAIQTQINTKSNLAGGNTFTGTQNLTGAVTNVVTQTAGDNTTLAASTAFVTGGISTEAAARVAADALKANLAGGNTFTGTQNLTGAVVNVPTQSPGDNTTLAASTAFVAAVKALLAPLASPALTGTPTAPTAAVGTNTTQIATMAAVLAQAFLTALPSQTGNSGKVPTTDGTNASWSALKTVGSMSLLGTGDIAIATLGSNTFTGSQTLPAAGAIFTGTVSGTTTLVAGSAASGTAVLPFSGGNIGYLEIPQNSQSTAYTAVLADSGKQLLHPSADTTARTFTIPANSSVAYPIGTALTFVNQNAAGAMTIAINTDTMRLAGAGTTGSRTLAANGVATAIKLTATEWIISGGSALT